MRLAALGLLAAFAALPATAQTLSPMTGTTSGTPAISPGPAAAPVTPAMPATPARRPRQTMQQRFDAANTTHDGKLTLEQARTANMTRVVRNFAAIDPGHQGYVTVADIQAYNRSQRAAHKAAAAKPQ